MKLQLIMMKFINFVLLIKYNSIFDQFRKIDFNGENVSSLYQYLKGQIQNDEINGPKNKLTMKGVEVLSITCKNPENIKWNFTKFLIDKEGKVIGRYSPTIKPEEMELKIKELLNIN